ncbi:hypothetical protein [Nakamurella sp.]|uniref:hypothetical protein n=1 Tax=Nakamurella sp. TaxID=1869182 RepID=UPI003783945B
MARRGAVRLRIAHPCSARGGHDQRPSPRPPPHGAGRLLAALADHVDLLRRPPGSGGRRQPDVDLLVQASRGR